MEDTTVKPINCTEIELKGILSKTKQKFGDSDTTSTATLENLPTEYDNTTSSSSNSGPINRLYNRKVWRYARAHKISVEAAFKRLYK